MKMRSARLSAHRLIGLWLLVTAPVLAVPVPGSSLRGMLVTLHLVAALLLLRPPASTGPLPGPAAAWRAARDLLPLLLVPLFYWEVPLLAETFHRGATYDGLVMGWEAALFGGQPSLTMAARWPSPWVSEPLHAAYLSYYLVVLVPAIGLYLTGRRAASRRVVFMVVLAFLAHQAVFAAIPVLGPRYLFPPPAGPLEAGPLYRLTHAVLEGGSSPGTAFPSSHVGISVAVTLALFRERLRAAPWVAGLTLLLAVATVYGGFHYAVDALAGAALGTAVAVAAPWLRARLARPRAARRAVAARETAGYEPAGETGVN